MATFELIMALIVAVVALIWLSDRIHIPYPMLLMIGGLALAIAPWTPTIELEPEIVLVIFLPPVLFQAAYQTSFRDFRANFASISRLAVGLVVVTTAAVAVVAHWVIPGIGWPAAFVLGAVVSPPDAVAATAIFHRLGAPRRIVTILEGESLINDASAIVVYTFAVAAVVTGTFSMTHALLEFAIVIVVGVAVGAVLGHLLGSITSILGDPTLAAIATLIAPAGAYVLAERLGGSGVLAVVMAGLVHSHHSSRTMSATARVRGYAIWDIVMVLINGFIFILIGFELGALGDELSSQHIWSVFGHAVVVLAVMVAARFLYIFVGGRLLRRVFRRHPKEHLDVRSQFLLAWSGLRGVVSLATALALPLVTKTGAPFDHREEIILITAAVIVFTLFGFGLPLPWMLRKLKLVEDGSYEQEMELAQKVVQRTMYDQLRISLHENPELEASLAPIIKEMKDRYARIASATEAKTVEEIAEMLWPRTMVRRQAIEAAREALLELRDRNEISDEVQREMERNLDLQELQIAE
ncbi:MAG: Na+/H+ antiporter [Thermomicrobiales bacterium]